MTSSDILMRLKKEFNDTRQWAFFKELRVGTGYREWDQVGCCYDPNNPEQRIDAWVINCYPSKKYEKIAFEVKISRNDFLNEIKNLNKRKQALLLSNRFYFAAPKGLINPQELPEECGLVEIEEGKVYCEWIKKAPWRDVEEPTWRFLASLARRIMKIEEARDGQ